MEELVLPKISIKPSKRTKVKKYSMAKQEVLVNKFKIKGCLIKEV
jgi:hypothetical protein